MMDKKIECNWKDKTVLIVDDEEFNLILLNELLLESKIKVICADNGEKAISEFKNNQNIDIILMDLQMPIVDGYKASSEIKAISSDVTIIAQTASLYSEVAQEVADAGCDDILIKPISYNDLIGIMAKHLNT